MLDAATFRTLATHLVNGGADYDWVGDTLAVTQLDYTSRWRIRSDLYHWLPAAGEWRRVTRGARLVAPAGGGGRLAAITLGPASGRPTVPAPPPSPDSGDALWTDLAPSPDGRWVAGVRCADGRWSLVLWPATSPADAVALGSPKCTAGAIPRASRPSRLSRSAPAPRRHSRTAPCCTPG